MTARQIVAMEITRLEAAHLAGLVGQFSELVGDSGPDDTDPAIVRLLPAAYADAEAAHEFRALTASDLLERRRSDAAVVLSSLGDSSHIADDLSDPVFLETVEIRLDPSMAQAWLRTLAAIRLTLATRLGIVEAEDHDSDDPRFGIYDWLGYRLDGLVSALDTED